MVISEATERSAETNLPDSSACSRSCSMVRRPSVAAASATACSRGRDAHVEVRVDVDAHAVLGDERVVLGARHAHLQHVHVDGRDVVNDRQHEGAAIDHHALAHETRTDERHLLGGSPIQPVDQIDDDRNRDDRHDQPQDDGPDQLCSHVLTPLARGPPPGPAHSLPSSPSLTSNRLKFPRLLRSAPPRLAGAPLMTHHRSRGSSLYCL